MGKFILALTVIVVLALASSFACATSIWFEPVNQLYEVGDTLTFGLYADIDEVDAIFGFGFDLSFDGGKSYILAPGDRGSFLTFESFTPNRTYFQYDPAFPPLWDNGDTIAGEVPLGDPDVWGTNILLGTFSFDAPSLGPIGVENIYLGPPEGDYGEIGEEGLLGPTALMPNNPTASATPVPVPITVLLLGSGLMGLLGFRRKFRNR